MNELHEMILMDVKEALFDICMKYEEILNIELKNGVSDEIEAMAASDIFGIMESARFKAMDAVLTRGGSYADMADHLPGIEGLTVGDFTTLCNGADLNYRVIEETPGGKHEIIFETVNGKIEGRYNYNDFMTRVLQTIETEEDENGEEGFFILTYYKR